MGTSCIAASVAKENGKALVIEGLEAALEALRADADGFTTAELSDATGWSRAMCRNNLRKLIDAGKIVLSGYKATTRIDGVITKIPAYKSL